MNKRTGQLVDETLVIEAQAGSAAALDALVHRWQRRLYAYAGRLLGHDDKAWDAVE
jgi:DNA-directed RNA polymerase specialized sigma24 family protein